jgi:hypothetical protein
MKKVKQNKVLAVLVFLLAVTLPGWSLAAEEGKIILDQNPEEGIQRFFDTLTPPNLFNAHNDELIPSASVYSSLLADIKVVPNPQNKKSYSSGDELDFKGALSYSSGTVKSRLEEKQKECLKQFSGKSEEEKNALCATGEISTIPSFSNVSVMVKIFRVDETPERNKTGDYMIDEFYVTEGMEIKDGEIKNFSFKWPISKTSKAGKYYAAFFVNSEKRFPLLGPPHITWSPLARFDFKVMEKDKENGAGLGIEIDKNALKINNASYSPVNLPPIIEPKDGKIEVKFSATNLDMEGQTVKIKYELRNWVYGATPEILNNNEETRALDSGEKTEFSYIFSPNKRDSFYTVKVTARTQESLSTANFYLVVNNRAKGMFSYLGVSKNAEGIFHPMLCALNAHWNGDFPGAVKISVNDSAGNKIAYWEGEGLLEPGSENCFMVRKITLDPRAIAGCLKLKGEILNTSQEIVDSIETSLNCMERDDKEKSLWVDGAGGIKRNKILVLALVVVLIITSGTLIYLNRKKDESFT